MQRDAPFVPLRPSLLHWLLPPPPSLHASILAYFITHGVLPSSSDLTPPTMLLLPNSSDVVYRAVSPFSSFAKKCRRFSRIYAHLSTLRFTRRSSILCIHSRTRSNREYICLLLPTLTFLFSPTAFSTPPYLYHCPRRTLTPYLYFLFLLPPFLQPFHPCFFFILHQGWLLRGDKFSMQHSRCNRKIWCFNKCRLCHVCIFCVLQNLHLKNKK